MSTSRTTGRRRTFPPRARKKGPRYHHGDLRRALLDAALGLVQRHGPAGFTLREAARAVGVTHTAPYRHFPDKAALLQALAEEGFSGMRDGMVRAAAGVADPMQRFQAIGVAYVSFAVSHPAHFRVMYSPEVDFSAHAPLRQVKQEVYDGLIAAIRACQDAGRLPAGPPGTLALTAWAIVHGLSALLIDRALERSGLGGDQTPEALARLVTCTVMDGMAGRG